MNQSVQGRLKDTSSAQRSRRDNLAEVHDAIKTTLEWTRHPVKSSPALQNSKTKPGQMFQDGKKMKK